MVTKILKLLTLVTICIANSRSSIFPQFEMRDVNSSSRINISQFINNLEEIASNEIILNQNETLKSTSIIEAPRNCSHREKLKTQPVFGESSRWKKCCPIGESLTGEGLNSLRESNSCVSSDISFTPNVINVVLYDNCIEDTEKALNLPLEIGNPCNTSFLYNDVDDAFYVLQDGSLLVMNKFGNETFTIENQYCMDIDNISGLIYVIICITTVEEHLKRSQILVVASFMIISIPCLLCVGYLHIAIKKLRTLHGVSLSLMSLCLALGYLFYSFAHIIENESHCIGYIVQFFILSYFHWFLCLCCNVALNIWIKIPLDLKSTKALVCFNLAIYVCLSFCGPLVLVILTSQKGLPGMPSYFIQGYTESIRESQRYFIKPVTCILFMSFLIMVFSFFGFKRFKNSTRYQEINRTLDMIRLKEVKKDAKCLSLLLVIMIISWILEYITFYAPDQENLLMEMINGLQGLLILLIFLVIRQRRTIILEWWNDRGTYNTVNIELSPVKSPINTEISN